MMMLGRTWSSGISHRYGFNSLESFNEITGTADSYLTETRVLDVRLGKWFSIDPLQYKHVEVSPYASLGCNPIAFVDVDGRENVIYIVILPSAKGKLSKLEQDEIINNLLFVYNDVYAGMNIPVDVRVFNENDRGQFNADFMDPSDVVVYIGSIDEVKERGKDAVAQFNPFSDWGEDPNVTPAENPEVSEPAGTFGTKGRVVGISIDGVLSETNTIGEKSSVELTTFLIFHGIGHNAGITHLEDREQLSDGNAGNHPMPHSPYTFGEDIGNYVNSEGVSLMDIMLSENARGEVTRNGAYRNYRQELKGKFTGSAPSDNYEQNKANRQ